MIDSIKTTIARDLDKLKTELQSYSDEQKIWIVDTGISNSAGNLCLHLLGNLNHFIGAVLGNTGYVRNRDLEFSQKDIPLNELLRRIDDTVGSVKNTFDKMNDASLDKDYPLVFNEQQLTTGQMLVNIVTHFNYHLGQINYHRRLLDK